MTRMKSLLAASLALVIGPLGLPAALAQQEAAAPVAVGHGAFPVKVDKSMDSSRLKAGDAVEVETIGSFKLADGTLVPKGSKVSGHVVSAKAKSKGDSESELTLAFDKLNIANGKQLSVKGTVQGVFPPAQEADPGVPGASTSHGSGPAAGQSGAPPAPDYRPMGEINTGSNPGGKAETVADPKSMGVHGMDNLSLEDGILTSKGKNVKLGGGVRMVVHVDIFQ